MSHENTLRWCVFIQMILALIAVGIGVSYILKDVTYLGIAIGVGLFSDAVITRWHMLAKDGR